MGKRIFDINSGLLSFGGEVPVTEESLQSFDLVEAKVATQQTAEIDALTALGFRLVEGKRILSSASTAPAARRIFVLPARNISRFYVKPPAKPSPTAAFARHWYKPGDSGRFYAQWVENGVNGAFDHQCLLALSPDGAIQGFVTLRELSDGSARIGLLATLPEAQGLGVGQRLTAAACDWSRARRLSRLHVATQLANLPALRLYQRCGGVIERTAYWFYR